MDSVLRLSFILFISLVVKLTHAEHYDVSKGARPQGRPDEKLTDDEHIKIFHKLPGEEFKYDFAQLITEIDVLKREHHVKFTFGNENFNFKLTPIDKSESVIPFRTPIYEVTTNEGSSYNYHFLAPTDERHDGSHIYEDRENKATIVLHYGNGTAYYDGVFGEGIKLGVIRSVPLRFALDYEAGEHFIYHANSTVFDGEVGGVDEDDSSLGSPLRVLYPKLLVIVDYMLFKNLDESLLECMRYLTVFWNAVNSKYRAFKTPRVYIKVTGIIVTKDETALKYMYDARDKNDDWIVNPPEVLRLCQEHFKNEFHKLLKFDNYDAVFTMTSHIGKGGIAGKANLRGICSEYENAAYVTDFGSYEGVTDTAHELGHLLGMTHDDKKCETQIDRNTATMMAATDEHENSAYVWSECSLRTLEKFAKSRKARCLLSPKRSRTHN